MSNSNEIIMDDTSDELWKLLNGYQSTEEDNILACINNHPEYCSIRSSRDNGLLPIHVAMDIPLSAATITRMLACYPDCFRVTDSHGNTLLHYISTYVNDDRMDLIHAVIDMYPEAISMKNSYDELPLHLECGCRCRYDVIVRMLAAYPDGISAVTNTSLPLHIALLSSHSTSHTIIYLINLYNDAVFVKDKTGALPLHFECMYQCRFDVIMKLLSIYPDAAGVRYEDLSSYYGDENGHDNGYALHLAVRNSLVTIKVLQCIYHSYPDAIKQQDGRNSTPLYYATRVFCVNTFNPSIRVDKKLRFAKVKFLLSSYPEAISMYESIRNELIIDVKNNLGNMDMYRMMFHIPSPIMSSHPPHAQLYHDLNWQYRSPLLQLILQLESCSSYHLTDNNHHRDTMIYTLLSHIVEHAGGKMVVDDINHSNHDHIGYDKLVGDDLGQHLLRHIISWL